ncbi:uncharacterized protein LOC120016920 [Tripterygium wilfordii]|uniref:uncharacterized protein LOC120016920 n=1 Tax=Tripterygium wilfordii TaxID=458696 RepID=UPI0018F7E684|nr:uncharacterized protein LOC120016920 [Tripterygium wilfordii]
MGTLTSCSFGAVSFRFRTGPGIVVNGRRTRSLVENRKWRKSNSCFLCKEISRRAVSYRNSVRLRCSSGSNKNNEEEGEKIAKDSSVATTELQEKPELRNRDEFTSNKEPPSVPSRV